MRALPEGGRRQYRVERGGTLALGNDDCGRADKLRLHAVVLAECGDGADAMILNVGLSNSRVWDHGSPTFKG